MLLFGAVLVAAPAVAAEPDVATEGLQEVVITAQFREEKLEHTPLSLSAVTAAAIEQYGMRDVTDVTRAVPNAVLQDGGAENGRTAQIFVRGVGIGDFNYSVEPGVAVYLDDVYLSGQFGNIFDLFDLERVEVLRGPQGTLFGKNAIGGAVRLISHRPDGSGTGRLAVATGSLERRDLRGMFDVPLIGRQLLFRMSASTRHREGFIDQLDFACLHPDLGGVVNPDAPFLPHSSRSAGQGCRIGRLGDEDVQAARAALRWLPSESLEVNVSADWSNDHSHAGAASLIAVDGDTASQANILYNPFGGFNGQVAIPLYGIPYDKRFVTGKPWQTYASFDHRVHVGAFGAVTGVNSTPSVNSVEAYGVTATVDAQLRQALKLRSIAAWRGYSGAFSQDVDESPLNVVAQTNVLDHHQFSEELQLLGTSFDSRVDWAAGVFYFDSFSLNRGPIELSVLSWLAPPLDFMQNDSSNIRDQALFAQATWHATAKLGITAGARYTDENKDYTFRHLSFDSSVPDLVPPTRTAVAYNKTNYRLAIDEQLTPRLLWYASVANAFRAGGFNGRPFDRSQVTTFGPETLTAFELGSKSEWLDRRLRINAAVFLSRYQDLQIVVSSLDANSMVFSAPANIGRSRITGGELEIEALPFANFLITASFGLQKLRIDELGRAIDCARVENPIPTPAPNANCSNGGATPGAPLPVLPEKTAALAFQYTWHLPGGSSVTPHADASYQSRHFADASGSALAAIDGRTLVNAQLAWESADRHWDVVLSGTNLTNRRYFLFKDSLIGVFGLITGEPGRPREWGIEAERRFFLH